MTGRKWLAHYQPVNFLNEQTITLTLMSDHKKKRIDSNYCFNKFEVSTELYPNRSEQWERCNVFLTKMQQRTFNNDFIYEGGGDQRFVYFSLKELRILLGLSWKDILQQLLDRSVITDIPVPNPKNPSQQLYTFNGLRNIPEQYKVRVTNARVHKSLNTFYDNRKNGLSPLAKGVILTNLRKSKINISDERFWEEVEKNYPAYCRRILGENRKPMSIENYLRTYSFLLYRITAFNAAMGREIYDFIVEDNFSKRIHTIFTQLPRFLRDLGVIEINGMKVVELDLAQSQPTILAKVLEDTDYAKWFHAQPDCYKALQEQYDLPSRDAAKIFMFHLMFGLKQQKYHKLFVEMFPQAGALLTKMKSAHNPNNPNSRKGKYHSNVAWEMQQRETSIFRDVWKKVNRARIPFLTIHDALLVPLKNYKEAREIMGKDLFKRFPNSSIKTKIPSLSLVAA